MKIERTEILCPNPWVEFKQKVYLDADGREKQWAYVERVNRQRAVFMVPVDPVRKQISSSGSTACRWRGMWWNSRPA